jgi:hypothetical protein
VCSTISAALAAILAMAGALLSHPYACPYIDTRGAAHEIRL